MAGTPLHHLGATALLPWTATAVTSPANLAALRYGRTARCHDRGGLVPRGGRSRAAAESGRDRSIVSGGPPPRGWRDGACWAAWSSGAPPPDGKNPARTAHGVPGGRVAGSPVETGPAATNARTRARSTRDKSTLDPRSREIVWLATVHRRRPVAPLAYTWRLSSVERASMT